MDDLTAAPRNRAAVPTFASYVPVVSAGVTDGMGSALAHMLREDHVACRVCSAADEVHVVAGSGAGG